MSSSNKSFFLGAGAMLLGVVAGNALRVSTLDNIRKVFYLLDEGRNIYLGENKPSVRQEFYPEDAEETLRTPNYDPLHDREVLPPPPSYENFSPAKAVSISLDNEDDDFFEKINEEASNGVSLIEDWIDA